jgi:hypothetical protein
MDLARWSRRAEWALAAAVLMMHLAIFLWPERSGQPDLLVSAAHDAQLYSAIVLIAAWAVLGPGWLWVRIGALPVLVVLWYLPWNTRMFPRDTSDSFSIGVGIAAAVLVVIVRCFGQRIKKSTGPERGAQFSLLALLALTTLIAAAIGLLEWLRPTIRITQNDDGFFLLGEIERANSAGWFTAQNLRLLVMSVAVAISAVGAIWVMMRPGAVWLRLAALTIAVGVFGTYQAHLLGVSSEQFTGHAISLSVGLACVAALTAVTLLPLRLMDFRLQRLPKVALLKSAESATPASNASPAAASERSRFLSRVAAMLGLFFLIAGGIPLVHYFWHARTRAAVVPPSEAFAEWMNPRRKLVILRGGSVEFTAEYFWEVDNYVWEVETGKVARPAIVKEGVIYEDRIDFSSP